MAVFEGGVVAVFFKFTALAMRILVVQSCHVYKKYKPLSVLKSACKLMIARNAIDVMAACSVNEHPSDRTIFGAVMKRRVFFFLKK